MAIAVATGVVDDSLMLPDEKIVDMDDVIAMLDPDVSQFTTMLMKIASSPAYNPKISWLEDQLFPRLSALGVSAATATAAMADTITVTTGDSVYFRPNDIVRIPVTGEAFRVLTVPSDALTVSRAVGAVTGATAAVGSDLVIIGNASLQGATQGTKKITKRVLGYNYQQIQRNNYGFTETLLATRLYGGNALDKERKKKLVEHKRAIENSLFFGPRNLLPTGTNGSLAPQGLSGGALEFISTNVTNATGTMSRDFLDNSFRSFGAHGSTNKVMFCAPIVSQAISKFARDNWVRSDPGDQVWGIAVDAFYSGAYGYRVPVIVKKDWNDFSTANSQWGGWAFVIDLDYVAFRPMRTTRLLKGRQANDADEQDEEYLTEFSLEFQQEKAHGVIKNVTGS